MKTIGVIGAMPTEVTLLRDRLSNLKTEKVAGLEIFIGELHDKNVVVCQSGMGKVAAGAATQVLITKYGVDAIINSGIAGNTSKEITVGDVVISNEVTYHDAEISMINQHYPYLDRYTADANMVQAAKKACGETHTAAITGLIASGDKFIGDSETKNKIIEFCNPNCVEMEGAAIAHIASKNDVPFVIIRAMSDDADEDGRAKLTNKEFSLNEYVKTATDIVTGILDLI